MHASQKIGLIAGEGTLPLMLMRRWSESGTPFFLAALDGMTPPETLTCAGVGNSATTSIGQAGKILKLFKENGVTDVVMAGGLRRPNFLTLKVDATGLRIVLKVLGRFVGDDTLLKIIRDVFESHGFAVRGAHEFLPEYLADSGVMGAVPVPAEEEARLAKGIAAALALGRADKGQAILIGADGRVIEEDSTGTNALLEKGRSLIRPVLVKLAKPQQDLALDMPTVGIETVRRAQRNGCIGITVNARKTMMVEKQEVIAACDAGGLFLTGYDGEGQEQE